MGRRPDLLSCFFGRGRRPDAPFVLLFQKQVKCSRKGTFQRLCRLRMLAHTLCVYRCRGGAPTPREMPRSGMLVAAATSISAAGGRKARGACCPVFCPAFSKAGEMFPTGNRFTVFSLLRKEPKVAQRVATLWTPRDGSKLY